MSVPESAIEEASEEVALKRILVYRKREDGSGF